MRTWITLLFATTVCSAGVDWEYDWHKAREKARAAGKPLLIVLGSQRCGPCQALEEFVWSDERVAKAVAERFAPFYVDSLAQRDHPAARKYRGFYLVLARADGSVLTAVKSAPFMTPKECLGWFDEAARAMKRIAALEQRGDARALVEACLQHGRVPQAVEVCEGWLAKEPGSVDARCLLVRALRAGETPTISLGGRPVSRADRLANEVMPGLLEAKDRRAVVLALAEPAIGGSGAWAARVLDVFPDAARLKIHAARQGMMTLTLDKTERRRRRAVSRRLLEEVAKSDDPQAAKEARGLLASLERLENPGRARLDIDALRRRELEDIRRRFAEKNRAEREAQER